MITYNTIPKLLNDMASLEKELADMADIRTGNLYRVCLVQKLIGENDDPISNNCSLEIIYPSLAGQNIYSGPIGKFMYGLGIPYRQYRYQSNWSDIFECIDPKSINIIIKGTLSKESKILAAIVRSVVFSVERKITLDESKGKIIYEKFAEKLKKFSTNKTTAEMLKEKKEQETIAAIDALFADINVASTSSGATQVPF